MTRVADGTVNWRKSSRSSGQDTCVELADKGAIRDSKNPFGPILVVDTTALVKAVKSGAVVDA